MRHQVIIIGSGLGGLLTALFLAKEGYDVGIIEQNKQIGGCLQTFSFDKKIFDSAVHYIGAMDEGQAQQRIFQYAGITDQLKMRRLDQECFDENWHGDQESSFLAQGVPSFRQSLINQFPKERAAIEAYMERLKFTTDRFPLFNLRAGKGHEKNEVNTQSLQEILSKIGASNSLQNAICGNAILYAGEAESTPFFQHALIQTSYINGAYKFECGSSQISKLLWKQISGFGGTIYRHEQVSELTVEAGKIKLVKTKSGASFEGDHFISNIHPQKTIELLSDPSPLKNIFRKRIAESPNTIGCLMLNLSLHPGKLTYVNHSVNWHAGNSLDSVAHCTDFPSNYSLYFTEDAHQRGFSESISVLAYIPTEWFSLWKSSYNTTASPSPRGSDYVDYKNALAEKLLQKIYERLPELKGSVQSMKVATPLSFRDYQGSMEGSMYGMLKDVRRLTQSSLTPQTKIPNLFLTGQNVNLHGILGVSMSALTTVGQFTGLDYLLQKINKR